MENNINNQQTHANNDVASTSVQSSRYPPGYHFMPTDQELITEYLAKKINNDPIPVAEMSQVNLYEHTPMYLAENYPQLGNKEWYFFTPRARKYPRGYRPSRSVGEIGFWKATGADIAIVANGEVIGRKKTLVFYIGKSKPDQSTKTDWIMHEYKLNTPSRSPSSNDMRLDDWVLCRIYQKPDRSNKKQKDIDEDGNDNIEDLEALDIDDINNDENHDDHGRVMMINCLGDNDYHQSQPNYQDVFNQVLPNNSLMVAGPSHDMDFYGQNNNNNNFDYGILYQQAIYEDYCGMGNHWTNTNFQQEYSSDFNGDHMKKFADDFMRDEEGSSNDGATKNPDGDQLGHKNRNNSKG